MTRDEVRFVRILTDLSYAAGILKGLGFKDSGLYLDEAIIAHLEDLSRDAE